MKKTSLFILSAMIIVAFGGNSCQKAAREEAQQSAKDNAIAESTFDDIFRQVDNGYDIANNQKKSANINRCATYTLSSYDNIFPKTLIIDFGAECVGNDGITRSGKIIATFSDRYRNTNSITTINLEDFKRNGKAVTGSKTITNQGPNSSGQPTYKIVVTNASITTEEGTVSWSSERTRVWTEGSNTPLNILDDVYEISGTAKGNNAKGNNFDIKISSPLHIEVGCRHITKGVIEITPDGGKMRTLDYGNGECDDQASLKIGNKTYNITLR